MKELEKVIGKQILIETLKNSSTSRQRETMALLVNEGFSISKALRYLKINRSTYYYKPKGYNRRTSEVFEESLILHKIA